MSQSYRSDLTDEQWEVIQTLIPPAKTGGRPRTVERTQTSCSSR